MAYKTSYKQDKDSNYIINCNGVDNERIFQPNFKLGEHVFCKTGKTWDSWKAASVENIKQIQDINQCGYSCKLASTGKKKFYNAAEVPERLRPLNFDNENHFQLLFHHLQWGETRVDLLDIIQRFKIDIQLIGSKLLLETAVRDHADTFDWLITDMNVNPTSRDEKGRNILHLAVMNKHDDYLRAIGDCGSDLKAKLRVSDLVRCVDNTGMNVLHFLVVNNSEHMLKYCLDSSNELGDELRLVYTKSKPTSLTTSTTSKRTHITQWTDSKGRTARDYAIAFKRTNFIALLDFFAAECQLQLLLGEIVDRCLSGREVSLSSFISRVEAAQFDLNAAKLSQQFEAHLQSMAFELCGAGLFHEARWLVEHWSVDLSYLVSMPAGRNEGRRYGRDVAEQTVKGPYNRYKYDIELSFVSETVQNNDHRSRLNTILTACFHVIMSQWSGNLADLKSLSQSKQLYYQQYDISTLCETHRLDLPTGISFDSFVSLVNNKIDQFNHRLDDSHSSSRCEILTWLIDTVKVPTPSILLFIQQDDVDLFVHIFIPTLHFEDPASTITDFDKIIKNLRWCDDGKSLSVFQFLCALAVQYDAVRIFDWLVQQCGVEDPFNFTVSGGAHGDVYLSHLAAIHNSYLITIYMIENKTIDVGLKTSKSGETVLHIAARYHYSNLCVLLMEFLSLDITDNNDHSAYSLMFDWNCAESLKVEKHVAHLKNRDIVRDFINSVVSGAKCDISQLIQSEHNLAGHMCWAVHLSFSRQVTESNTSLSLPSYESIIEEGFTRSCPLSDLYLSDLYLSLISLAVRHECVDLLEWVLQVLADNLIKHSNGLKVMTSLLDSISASARDHNYTSMTSLVDRWKVKLQQLKPQSIEIDRALDHFEHLWLSLAKRTDIEASVNAQRLLFKQRAMEADNRRCRTYLAVIHDCSYCVPVTVDNVTRKVPLFQYVVQHRAVDLISFLLQYQTLEMLVSSVDTAVHTGDLSIVKLLVKRIDEVIEQRFHTASVDQLLKMDSPVLPATMLSSLAKHGDRVEVMESPSVALNRAILRAIFVALGRAGQLKWSETQHSAEISRYLVEQAVVRCVDLNSYVQTSEDISNTSSKRTVLQHLLHLLTWHDHPDLWAMLRVALDSEAFDLNASLDSSVPLVVDLLECFSHKLSVSVTPFHDRMVSVQTEEQRFSEELSSSGENTKPDLHHFKTLLRVLVSRGLNVHQHSEIVVDSFVTLTEAKVTGPFMANVLEGYFVNELGIDVTLAGEVRSEAFVTIRELQKKNFQFRDKFLVCKDSSEYRNNGGFSFQKVVFPDKRRLLHLAALQDNAHMARFLIDECGADLSALDGHGFTALDLCVAAGSTGCEMVIRNRMANLKLAVVRIQTFYRMYVTRREFRKVLEVTELDSDTWEYFQTVWGQVMKLLGAGEGRVSSKSKQRVNRPVLVSQSWASIRQQHDIQVVSAQSSTPDVLNEMFAQAARVQFEEAELGETDEVDLEVYHAPSETYLTPLDMPQDVKVMDNVELSQAAVKWLEGADGRYKSLFQDRVERLAEGDRSYALSKRLKGCDYPIYETKLDSGQRILWTQLRRTNKLSILVWFVSKHDDVGTQMRHIDKSYSRLSRLPEILHESDLQMLGLEDEDVLLDPVGNCPLKIYTATRGDIPLLTTAGWTPPLRLGAKQQEVQELSGTVLLLGRSGTGKTVCLSDRMTRDRHQFTISGVTCHQLFVSRSRRLCEFVKYYQEQQVVDKSELDAVDFMTLDRFVNHLEAVVATERPSETPMRTYSSSRRVEFAGFRATMDAALSVSGLDAVVVWTQIRSFIKGSIEAVMQRSHLTLEQYLDFSVFGLERCRLQADQRKKAFVVYKLYQDKLNNDKLWDDADRVLDLLTRSKLEPLSACNNRGADYHKLYVDEVQDNTQAEIVLYFLAAGMNTQSLFLAGDPAQSVVEGVDFRFEDVRRIVYLLSAGRETIERPSKLFVNYRSHAGILNCAAAVLDKMFAMFPGSAKVLSRDAGLFKGPRPAFCNGVDNLLKLLRQDQHLVVICSDEKVSQVDELLSDNCLVNLTLGIRAAKGLEFQDIVLYDFFSSIPAVDHKAWRSLLTDKQLESKPYSHPQIESQLKLLYTAITRSCNRLIFVESKNTPVCSSFFRWLKAKGLADALVLLTGEKESVMTSDEWRVQGIDFALSAEGDSAVTYLEKAERCFELAGDNVLLNRARTQLDMAWFRRRVSEQVETTELITMDEADAAALIVKGLNAHLLQETKEFCVWLSDRVKQKKYFKQFVTKLLPNDV